MPRLHFLPYCPALCVPVLCVLSGLWFVPSAAADAPADRPPSPAVFGIRPGDRTAATRAHLRAAGYVSRSMTNGDGCVVEHFEHASEDAPIPRTNVWLCGPERRVARLDMEGPAGERFYRAARERFQLGANQREGDPVGPRYGNYTRDFADGVRLTMTNTRGSARLRLEDPEALRRAAAMQEEAVRRLEDTAADDEQRRRERQDTFF